MVEIANLIKTGSIPLSDPRPGSVCLAQYTDGVWYRARIEYCSPNSRQIKVGEQFGYIMNLNGGYFMKWWISL